ncbi:helix-turn-helix domain-containing protein [Lysinibacillus sp. RSDA_15]|uniref:helix-turn-helix domain-containing protein n=1 Tax=Lysinibacillus sp. RSDA_15 TaxID=3391421 RepID=UPI003A4D3257
MGFGNYLKTKRTDKNLSMNKLGELAGITAMYISQLESGKREKPSIEVLKKLSISLKEPYENLLEAAGYSSIEVGNKDDIAEFLRGTYEIRSLPETQVDDLDYLLSSENEIFFKDRILTKIEKTKIKKLIEIVLED